MVFRLQDCDVRSLVADMTEDNTSYTVTELDTLGYDELLYIVAFGNVPADVGALTLTESDSAGSGHANITASVIGTAADMDGTTSVLPTAAAGDGDVVMFQIDLRNRKRYIDATITAGNGGGTVTECAVIAILSKAKTGFDAAADYDAETVMRF